MPTWAGLSCWYKKLTKANVLKPQKLFWFGVMAFVPVGPPLYCFIVYSRSDVLQEYAAAKGADAMST